MLQKAIVADPHHHDAEHAPSNSVFGFWLYLIGALFILVPMFLPKGLAGVLDRFREHQGDAQ